MFRTICVGVEVDALELVDGAVDDVREEEHPLPATMPLRRMQPRCHDIVEKNATQMPATIVRLTACCAPLATAVGTVPSLCTLIQKESECDATITPYSA